MVHTETSKPIRALRSPHAPAHSDSALHRAAVAVEGASALDPLVERLAAALPDALGQGRVRDALSGRWLGHALHPLLTDIPIGAWTSASMLDVLPGAEHDEAAQWLLAIGLLAALPTVAAGASDWLHSDQRERRVGVVHMAANSVATLLYAASLIARRAGRRKFGVKLALGGGALASAGGLLGGHLSATRGTALDNAAPGGT